MPGIDKTGPLGTGPIGRGLGPCGEGGTARGWGGRRFGRGGGWWNWRVNSTPEDRKTMLENEKTWLDKQLEAIKQRLEELDK